VSEVTVITPGSSGKRKRYRRKDLESGSEGCGGGLCGGGDVLKESGGEEAHNGLSGRGRAKGSEFWWMRVLGPVG
jgi:hypothetical protein